MATAVCGPASSSLAACAIQSHTHRGGRQCCLVQPQVLRVFWPVSEVEQMAEEESHRERTDLLLLLKAEEQLHDELLTGRKRAVRLEWRDEGVALAASALFAIGG